MSKKLVIRSIHVPNEVDLKWIRENMENKIDAVLCCDDQCIEYKEYESEAMYNARIQRENYENNLKNDPDYQKYLELKKRFHYYDQ